NIEQPDICIVTVAGCGWQQLAALVGEHIELSLVSASVECGRQDRRTAQIAEAEFTASVTDNADMGHGSSWRQKVVPAQPRIGFDRPRKWATQQQIEMEGLEAGARTNDLHGAFLQNFTGFEIARRKQAAPSASRVLFLLRHPALARYSHGYLCLPDLVHHRP